MTEPEVSVTEADAILAAAKEKAQFVICVEAKFDAWLKKLKKIAADATKKTPVMPKPVAVKKGEDVPPLAPQVNVHYDVGRFTAVVKALNGRRCPKVVRDLLSRAGEWVERGVTEYAENNVQNAIDSASMADIYNRSEKDEPVEAEAIAI